MPTASFSKSGTALLKALVNDQDITFDTSGNATTPLVGGSHPLTWVVLGAPGQSYTIAITAPATAVFSHSATLDGSGKDAGVHWFMV